MNPIEQLGGYEKSKEVLELIKARDHKYSQNFERPALEKALLQYRREHNIFEEEDYVFDDEGSELMRITCFYLTGEPWCCIEFCKTGGCFDTTHLTGYRHATDAEIKAGHRL